MARNISHELTGCKRLMHEDGSLWKTVLKGLSELVGTAILVFIGCMGCVGSLSSAPPHLQISFTFAFAVLMAIQCFGHISEAHINPAITIGAVALGRKSIPAASIYILGQILGGIIGYGLLKVVTPHNLLHGGNESTAASFCVTEVNSGLSGFQGLIVEGIATAILMLVACAIWDPRNSKNTDSIPIKFGLVVGGLAMAVGPYTGCSMNPARSLGPAIWNNSWSNHWVYWFGPIGGALIAAIIYRVFQPKAPEEEPEIIPLNEVDSEKA